MELTEKYRLDHLGRAQSRWGDIFDTIDSNFDKIDGFLSDISTRVHVTHLVADEDQTDFTLDDVYLTDSNSLAVYKNGVRQFLGEDFRETGPQTFTMMEPCETGDKVVAVYNEFYLPDDTSSLEVQIYEALTSLKRSVYGDSYDTLDEAIEASISHARESVTDMNSELLSKIDEKSKELSPLQDRLTGILERLSKGEFFDGVRVIWYTPHASEDGTISWTNNGGLENPEPVKLDIDITIPMGTVAIGSSKGGYTYTDASQYGALVRSKPSLGDRNPVPHFGPVPVEYGGLGSTEDILALKGYKGPLEFDSNTRSFKPILGDGVLIRDKTGLRFGTVPVEYGGTGTSGISLASNSEKTFSEIALTGRDVFSLAISDGTLDHLTWQEISEASSKAVEDPKSFSSWIGKTKTFRLGTDVSEPTGIDIDRGVSVKATIVGIATDNGKDNGRNGFIFSMNPLVGAYAEDGVDIEGDSDGRDGVLDAYFEILPDDLKSVMKPIARDGGEKKLFIPTLSDLGLYEDAVDEYASDYDIGEEGTGCLEYFAMPRDLFFDKAILGGDTDRLSTDERYVLDSYATPRTGLMEARSDMREFLRYIDDVLDGSEIYEPSETDVLRTIARDCRMLLDDDHATEDDVRKSLADARYFFESMVTNLDSMTWDDVFDLVYEMSVKSPTMVDRESQLERLLGMSKSVHTKSFGDFEMGFMAHDIDGNGTLTFMPLGGVLFNSSMRDDGSLDGGYNRADILRDSLSRLVSELPVDLVKYLHPVDRVYNTPGGYESWVTEPVVIPSVRELDLYPDIRSKIHVGGEGEPDTYWTRDVED